MLYTLQHWSSRLKITEKCISIIKLFPLVNIHMKSMKSQNFELLLIVINNDISLLKYLNEIIEGIISHRILSIQLLKIV